MKPSSRTAAAVFGVFAMAASVWAQDESYRKVDGRDCCIADMPFATSGGLTMDYVMPADTSVPGWDEFSAGEISGWARFGNWENESGADFDLQGLWDTMLLDVNGDAGDIYPLTMARVRLVWTQRFEENYTFEGEASPGLYSGFETVSGDDFSVPFGGRWIVPITPDFSVFAGANVYPTFDFVFDPRLGLRLAQGDSVVFDLGYPETRIVLTPGPQFRFTGGVRVSLWPEYNMGNDVRERIRYDETRIYANFDLGVGEYTSLSLYGGVLMNREIAFESQAEDVKIDDGVFVGIGFTRML